LSVDRLKARFAQCRAEGRAAFVAYLMAGDPDADTALEILRGCPSAART
jgi:tryptophan synthase alpha chain